MLDRATLKHSKRWVVKLGSALLTDDGRGVNVHAIAGWVDQIAELKRQGVEVVLVSSGAIAEGMVRLGLRERPHQLNLLQAAAAVGQMGLVQIYESHFQRHQFHTAQILLTHDDLANRTRYLNARSTLRSLLELGVVPIVNENDTVVTDEIRFGDNDTLAARVANLLEAEVLVLLTDQQGMFDADPRTHAQARLIQEANASDPALQQMATEGRGQYGRGGMIAKVKAGELAARSGALTIIAGGREPEILLRLWQGEQEGTLLKPDRERWAARKQWLAGHLQTRGKLHLDAGAVRALCEKQGSLLAVGVTKVEGRFHRGEVVECLAPEGHRVACGLINYTAEEARRICGKPSDQIEALLGYVDEPELIHRDNLAILT